MRFISYKTVHTLQFPIFLLESDEWEYADGILFLGGRVLDDTNQVGLTLGARRLQTPFKSLVPLRKMISTPNGILKQSTQYFIDNKGMPFIYEKTKFMHLKYLKIKRVEKKGTGSLVFVKGSSIPFTVPRPPSIEMIWAGVLHHHKLPWMLYEYSETKLKDTKRKV
tara:strand:- start:1287 stop:1784 length:498 start_codon:yes stop_codon:yes gene_type:complete